MNLLVWVVVPSICQEIASASRTTATGVESIPYVVYGGNLWYVADLPFSYVSEEDRYLVLCDLLYDILGITPPNTQRAIYRIEDVEPTADPAKLRAIADYLSSRNVPFAASVIPVFADPFGVYNAGVADYDQLSWEPELVDALKYMVSKGGRIILHGYTRQYDTTANPYNGVTGDDFEIYRVRLDTNGATLYTGPLPGDSQKWAARSSRASRAWGTPSCR